MAIFHLLQQMKDNFMNKIELANEVFVLITGYFMLLFTDYAAPNARY